MEEEDLQNRFQAMIRAEHATYAAFQRPRYVQLIKRIEQVIGHKLKKESGDYRILKRFEVCKINGEKRLMKRATGKIFVCTDELFEIIKKAHLDTNQKGESKTLRELGKTYANITRDQVKAFLHLCQCQLCVRTKLQAEPVSGPSGCESNSLPNDAVAVDPNQQGNMVQRKDGSLSLGNNDSVNKPGTSMNTRMGRKVLEQKHAVTNGTPTPVPKKRIRRKLMEPIDALKQCEVVLKEDDNARVELSDSVPVASTPLINGNHHPFSVEDTTKTTIDEPLEGFTADNFGTWLQQLAECQRQLLYVESRRLALEEVRLQVDQQMAANLMEIVNHLKQPKDKNTNEQP